MKGAFTREQGVQFVLGLVQFRLRQFQCRSFIRQRRPFGIDGGHLGGDVRQRRGGIGIGRIAGHLGHHIGGQSRFLIQCLATQIQLYFFHACPF
jgi:hypothetical protein